MLGHVIKSCSHIHVNMMLEMTFDTVIIIYVNVSRETLNMNTEKFEKYYQMLIETNEKFNLTAITDREEVFIKHFEDSLKLSDVVKDIGEKSYKIIDVGSGAGFPGIPLAIEYPNIQVCVTDTLRKRTNFLQEVVDALSLKNVKVVWSRAEDLAHDPSYRASFDIATARAVANLSTLTELCGAFVHKDGWFIPYKSAAVDDEISLAKNACGQIGLKLDRVYNYSLSQDMGARSLLIYKKISTTPDRFPRKAGTPSKKPL